MKNIILTAIVTLSISILTSCAKKGTIEATTVAFFNNPFASKSILATAD